MTIGVGMLGLGTVGVGVATILTSPEGRHPLVVSTDVRRPAAIQQLSLVAKQAGVRVHDPEGDLDPVRRASGALA